MPIRIVLALALFASCGSPSRPSVPSASTDPPSSPAAQAAELAVPEDPPSGRAQAVFAGGCFWCMEPAFERVPGVDSVESGFTGGHVDHPTYEQVSAGGTGHYESVRVVYDPARVTYEALLDVFFRNVDPTQADGQFCDRGDQYRSAIFVRNDDERRLAEAAKARAGATLGRPIVTAILPAARFFPAEAYHQDFYRTHVARYQEYRLGCGRDARLHELWGAAAGAH